MVMLLVIRIRSIVAEHSIGPTLSKVLEVILLFELLIANVAEVLLFGSFLRTTRDEVAPLNFADRDSAPWTAFPVLFLHQLL
jgi:hypothetical protein